MKDRPVPLIADIQFRNLLEDSSFECGGGKWLPLRFYPAALDQAEKHSGAYSCRLGGPDAPRTIGSRFFYATHGLEYTFSFWAKAAANGALVTASITSGYRSGEGETPGKPPLKIESAFALGKEWREYSCQFTLPRETRQCFFVNLSAGWKERKLILENNAPVWVDDLMVCRAGGLKGYRPRSLIEIGARIDGPVDTVYRDGEPVKISLFVHSHDKTAGRFSVPYRLYDIFDRAVISGEKKITCAGNATIMESIPLTDVPRGCFRLEVEARTVSGNLLDRDEIIFSVFPKLPEKIPNPEASPFGGHIEYAPTPYHPGEKEGTYFTGLARKTGVRWQRLHDMGGLYPRWWKIEFFPGRRQWLDDQNDFLKRQGLEQLGVLANVPVWERRSPEISYSQPRDLNRWAKYVRETVRHYRDSIKYWEVWNEPFTSTSEQPGFWQGTAKEYVDLLRVTYQAAKETHPECKILGICGQTMGLYGAFLEKVFDCGANDYLDIYSYHKPISDFNQYGKMPEEAVPTYSGEILRLREVMAEHGGVKPIWNTESAAFSQPYYRTHWDGSDVPNTRTYPQMPAGFIAAWSVQAHVVSLACGVEKFFRYFLGESGGCLTNASPVMRTAQNLLEYDLVPRPEMAAVAALALFLEGKTFRTLLRKQSFRAYVFAGRKGTVAVCWADFPPVFGLEVIVPDIGRSAACFDLMANNISGAIAGRKGCLRLGREPVYLMADGSDAEFFQNLLEKITVAQ